MRKDVPPAWIECKRRARIYWLFLLVYFPLMACLWSFGGVIQRKIGLNIQVPFVVTGFFSFAGVWAWVGFRWAFWSCPRCGKPYFYKFPLGNVLRRKCVHCGLEKWTEPLSKVG